LRYFVQIVLFFFFLHLGAQLKHPKASPFSQIEQHIGLSKIQVEYSRPAVKNRTIFGDLVPYGRIWRVGANASTKITFDTDIKILGNTLVKGTYALYAFPEKEEWTIVFHKNTTHWGDGRKAYKAEEDALRIRVHPERIPYTQENFLITFDSITHNSLNMLWIWEHTKISIPMVFHTEVLMREEIKTKLRENPNAQTYYEAARYFQEQNIEQLLALTYLDKAIDLGGDTYYFHRVKSLVQASLGQYTKAVDSAKKSAELAAKEEKDEFVRMNKKNIDIWEKLIQD